MKIKRASPVKYDLLFVQVCKSCGRLNFEHSPEQLDDCLVFYMNGECTS